MTNDRLTCQEIVDVWEGLGGSRQFLKSFGYLQFAQTIEEIIRDKNHANEQRVIAAFLERTGQYVTNDTSREAVLKEARNESYEAAARICDQVSLQPAIAERIRSLKSK